MTRSGMQSPMQFVLVHGAWHGAWCWSRVLPFLRAAGHEAHALTLTGVGERAHLLSAQIRLHTHVGQLWRGRYHESQTVLFNTDRSIQ